MEWLEILKGPLASTPVAAVLAFGVHRLWVKLEDKDKLLAVKDAEIARLSEARVQDLKAIAKQND